MKNDHITKQQLASLNSTSLPCFNTDSVLNVTLPENLTYENRKQFAYLIDLLPDNEKSRYKGLSLFYSHKEGSKRDVMIYAICNRIAFHYIEFAYKKLYLEDSKMKSALKTHAVLRSQIIGLFNTLRKHNKTQMNIFPHSTTIQLQ